MYKNTKIKIRKKLNSTEAHNLIEGDSLDVLSSIPENYADHCITDPPYNISGYDGKKKIGWLQSNEYWSESKKFNKIDEKWDKFYGDDYESFTTMWLKEIFRIVKPNGNIIIFGSYHNIYKIGYLLQKSNKKLINSIVWYKRNAFPNITQRMFCESTEHIVWAVNNDPKRATKWVFNYAKLKQRNVKKCKNCKIEVNYEFRFCPYCSKNDFEIIGLQMRNVWNIPMTPKTEKNYGVHPAQKPLAVVDRLIVGCTDENDIVIDPFAGSGTIPLVAMMNKRRFIAIEKDSKFCEITKKRLEGANKQQVFEEVIAQY